MALDLLFTGRRLRDLAHRARPLALALRRQLPEANLWLALPPGPHAQQAFTQVSAWDCFDLVLRPDESLRLALTGRNDAVALGERGIVVCLGSQFGWRQVLSYRLGWPSVAYTETVWHRLWGVQRLLLADQGQYVRLRARGHAAERLAVVGPLMADALRPSLSPQVVRTRLGISERHPLLGLVIGTQPRQVQTLLPMFLQAFDQVSARLPALQAVLPLPGGLPLDSLAGPVATAGAGFTSDEAGHPAIVTASGRLVRIVQAAGGSDLSQTFDLAFVGPGVDTAELGCLGVPMVTVCPAGWPDSPGRPLFSRLWPARSARKHPFVAWPNRKAGRLVTPELIGSIGPTELAIAAMDLLGNGLKRRQISLDLRTVMGAPGAAGLAAEQIRSVAEAHYPDLGNLWPGETAGTSR